MISSISASVASAGRCVELFEFSSSLDPSEMILDEDCDLVRGFGRFGKCVVDFVVVVEIIDWAVAVEYDNGIFDIGADVDVADIRLYLGGVNGGNSSTSFCGGRMVDAVLC